MVLGGSSAISAVENTSITGYECFECVAYNNIVIAETPGAIKRGLAMLGCRDCGVYNNTVIGAQIGLKAEKVFEDSIKNGWDWSPDNPNAIFKNNIVVNSTISAVSFPANAIPGNPIMDYNLYYNNPNEPVEPNGVYADPKFINITNDWYLQEDSPAINAGTSWSFTGYFNEIIHGNRDREGVPRATPWDIGPYEVDYGNLCIADTKVFADIIQNRVYQYKNTIEAGHVLPSTTAATFKAGESITLSKGFHAIAGSAFLAKIENCETAISVIEEAINEDRNRFSTDSTIITKSNLKAYPNPIIRGELLTIELPQNVTSLKQIQVYSIAGQEVLNYSYSNFEATNYSLTLSTTNLAGGMYLLLLETNAQKLMQKIIVQE